MDHLQIDISLGVSIVTAISIAMLDSLNRLIGDMFIYNGSVAVSGCSVQNQLSCGNSNSSIFVGGTVSIT